MKRSLKISIAASGLILATAAGIGWREAQQLTSASERNVRLVSQAARLGISISSLENSVRITKRARESRDTEDRSTAIEMLSLIRELDEIEKNGGNVDDAGKALLSRITSLGPGVTGMLIAEVRAAEGIDGGTRDILLSVLLLKLSSDNPQAVLRLLPELTGTLSNKDDDQQMQGYLLTNSLTSWGKKDPLAVAGWLRENQSKFPDSINDGVKCGILAGVVSRDPALAFKLIDEIGIKEKGQAVTAIARGARTAEQRSAVMATLRAQPVGEGSRELMNSAIQELAAGAIKGGFDSASQWLESARLDSAEMADVGSSLEFHHTQNETGQWLDWLGGNLPSDKAGEPIGRLMGKWTEIDYQAAGRWLAAAPEVSAKTFSIQAYAGAVSKYEPETAAQWAMTLPAGRQRDETLRNIYQKWPKDDPTSREAAEAFKNKHGIK